MSASRICDFGTSVYRLGCPIWSHKSWVGEFFTSHAKPKDHLRQYASVFNTIEGNTTFYGIPKEETVAKWDQATFSNFKFCFKFPKTVSHILQLRGAQEETARFLRTLGRLEEKVGLFFLQLPPSFSHQNLLVLKQFLEALPKEFCYAVEVRHPDFFESPKADELNDLLSQFGVNRVMFDTGVLHAIDSLEESIVIAQGKKPKLKEYFVATGPHPFLRFVGYNEVKPNIPRLTYLAEVVSRWIKEGREPYVFMHSPDSVFEPHLCRQFHELVAASLEGDRNLEPLPAWPCEGDLPLFASLS